MRGKIKWWNRVKGYGFIIPDDGSPEVFFHHTKVREKRKVEAKLGRPQQAVEFEAFNSPKGPQADFVEVVDLMNP